MMFYYRNPSIFVSEINRFSNAKAFTYMYCEVKFALEQAMKAQKESRDIALVFL